MCVQCTHASVRCTCRCTAGWIWGRGGGKGCGRYTGSRIVEETPRNSDVFREEKVGNSSGFSCAILENRSRKWCSRIVRRAYFFGTKKWPGKIFIPQPHLYIYTGCFILILPGKYFEKFRRYKKMIRIKVLWLREGHKMVQMKFF